MTVDIKIDPRIDTISMPENLKVGLMIANARKACNGKCDDDFAGFAFGQSPFHVPESLANALARNANKGHYSEAEGILELREAVADFNKRHFRLNVDSSRIIIGPGTKDLIFTVFSMISGSVIIPAPSWIGYYPQLKLLGKQYHPYKLRLKYDFKIQPDELDDYLAKLAHEKTQHLLVINNPHNPTGQVYSKEELSEIVKVCRRHDTLILADEIYALSTYNVENFTSLGLLYPEGAFITNGLSKDRSAGGYRLGSCILPSCDSEKLFNDFSKIAATVYTNVSTPTQYAAVEVYRTNEEIDEYLKITREIHRMMGWYFSKEFNKSEGVVATKPKGGFYFYADFNQLREKLNKKGIMNSNELGQFLLSHPYHVAMVTGDTLMLSPDDYGARIAFVDYNGKEAFERYKANPPKSEYEEIEFVKNNAPLMINGIDSLKTFIEFLEK
ncbi:MAG: pyridoxal phosphate-dependent aminotransferase [Deltaproteobacteria bacterium]|nr:pyridoxal phosphate-dependent aminotransferase [Deltaproteobacteria bacterium]